MSEKADYDKTQTLTETDPIFAVSPAHGITPADLIAWDGAVSLEHPKQHALDSPADHSIGGLTDTYLIRSDGTKAVPATNTDAQVAAAVAALHPSITLDTTLATNLLTLATQLLSLNTQPPNYTFAGPLSGAPAPPAFRTLVAADIPGHPYLSRTIINQGTTSYTVPAGVHVIRVVMWGGGGGGGGTSGSASNAAAGSGGGAGSYLEFILSVTPGAVYTVAVGAKGTGGAAGANNGNPGVITTWGDPVVYTAGYGGAGQGQAYGTGLATLSGGSSILSTGGNINGRGVSGLPSIRLSATSVISGMGGSSYFGGGGSARTSHGAGGDSTTFVGGGGGAVSVGAGDNPGGNGANGIIIVWEYA